MKCKSWDIFLILYFAYIGLVISFLLSSYFSIEYGGMISNRFYTSKAISFILTDTDAELDELLPAIKNSQILWKELTTETRGIYFKGDVMLPIRSGQSLDFNGQTPQMMRGEECDHTLDGFTCRGYLGATTDSALDSYAFYSLPEIVKITGIDGKWVLDGKDIENTFHELEKIVGEDKLIRTSNSVEGYFRAYNPVPTEQFYLSLIVLLIGASCLITIMFLSKQYKLLRICNLIGISLKNILRLYIIKGTCLLGVAAITCVTSLMFKPPFFVFGKLIDTIAVAVTFLLFIFMLIFISGGITVRFLYDMERD